MVETSGFPRLSANPSDEHAFHELGSKRFEQFARALHEAQPDILGSGLYGPDGQEQFGVDHYAFHRSEGAPYLEVGQAKAERRFSASDVRAAADRFLAHWDSHWREKDVRKFILFVGCAIKNRRACDEIIAQTSRFGRLGVEFSVWDSTAIYDRLPGANVAVRTYLGQDWYERIFGKPSGPLSGLQQDLEKGWDLSALRLQGYVTRLNQAETGEIAELKRRARRGEVPRVISELENALRSEAAEALASPVKAEKLRLLAGLLMASEDFIRVRELLDQADQLDGDSTRLRAILLLESVGPDALINGVIPDGKSELAEVRAVALLRLRRAADAFEELGPFVRDEEARAETLRLAALAKLVAGERGEAVELAQRAVARDTNTRACQQALAICLFHRALSPAAEVATGEWPQPIDQPLVAMSDQARADLERAESIFRSLMTDTSLEGHRAMVMWHFGVLACMPWRHSETNARLSELQQEGQFPIPLIAWALSRALPFDRVAAATQCDAALATDPEDFETLFIRVALANAARDFVTARKLLASSRAALHRAGHAGLYAYWTAVLDLESRQDPSPAALREHPWLRLRQAMDLRRKKARREAIAKLLEEELAGNGDARVILVATQLLLEAGWHRTAVKAAPFLVESVATAEAVAAAAHAYFRNEQPSESLAALEHLEVFPGNRLPVELERLRANCLIASGELVGARDASVAIARSTRQPEDLWRSIQLQLAIGAAPEALALYEEHAEALSAPSPGHIALARAVLQTHPEAAVRITRHISANPPDEYVTAAFDLANKLKMSAEQRVLTGHIQRLGIEGKGGVSLISLDDIVAMMQERREKVERAFELYANGHAPVHVMASFRQGALASAYLGPLLDPPKPMERLTILSTRYGRRLEEDDWPADRIEVRLLADITALLTAHGLGLLDTTERAFAPLWISPEAVQTLLELRSDVEVAQPDRVDAMRSVLVRLADGDIQDQSDLSTIDTFHVLWEGDGGEPNSTLSFHRLFELLARKLGKKTARAAKEKLGNTLQAAPLGAKPPLGAVLTLEPGIAATLEEANLLSTLSKRFRVGLSAAEIAELRANIADAERRQNVVVELSELIDKLRLGLEDGTYKTVPAVDTKRADHIGRSYMQLLDALSKVGGIAWVDDRYTSSINNPQFQTATTVEIIDALVRYGRLKDTQAYTLRQRLRAGRWLFMPLRGEEIAHFVRSATHQGQLSETEDLAVIRRAIGEALLHRRRLQWPEPAAVDQGIRGEVPYLLDSGHAITQALVEIWSGDDWSVDDAEAASEWIIDTLEMSLYPLQVLPAGDPRSDHLLGIHLGGLVLVAIQIFQGKQAEGRQRAYLEWLWRYVLANMLRVRPEIRPALEEMIEGHLTRTENGFLEDGHWLALGSRVLNAMPLQLRVWLLQRPGVREAFKLPDHGQVSVDGFEFDELEFWEAIVGVGHQSRSLKAVSGETAKLRLINDAPDQHVQLTIGRRKMRLDCWPRRIASDDPSVRRSALLERIGVMDMSMVELEEFNNALEEVQPSPMRIRTAMARAHDAMQQWYADFDSGIRDHRAFALADLKVESIKKVVRHLRLDDDLELAAARLIKDRGLAIAVRRLGGLPIAPPATLRAAITQLEEPDLMAFLDDVEADTSPPWTQLFLADALLERALDEETQTRIRGWIDSALSERAELLWDLYIALAQFTAVEAFSDNDWRSLSAPQQLAACWSHANAMTEILVAGHVVIEKLLEMLTNNRLVSPRILVENLNKFEHDMADPRQISTDRLRVNIAAPALFRFRAIVQHGEWAEAALRRLIVEEAEDGAARPRMAIARGALAADNCLPSRLSAALGEQFDAIYPNAGAMFPDGIENLLTALLNAEPDTREALAGWHLLREAATDAALPSAIANLARERGELLELSSEGDDLQEARRLLLTFTAVAAANGWVEEGDRIDTASVVLGPRPNEQDTMILFEIAIWRSRMVEDTLERTRFLSQELLRLARHEPARAQAIVAARHFARNLSGQQAEAFVDVVGELSSTY